MFLRVLVKSFWYLSVSTTHKKSLERQVTEGIHIVNSKADYLLNSKSEYMQPAVRRVITTREVGSWGPTIFRTEFKFNFSIGAKDHKFKKWKLQIFNSSDTKDSKLILFLYSVVAR